MSRSDNCTGFHGAPIVQSTKSCVQARLGDLETTLYIGQIVVHLSVQYKQVPLYLQVLKALHDCYFYANCNIGDKAES